MQRTRAVEAVLKRPTHTPSPVSTPVVTSTLRLQWWTSIHSYLLLTLATILCLAPFSGRAFHVDDALFIWAAKQISQHPFNPYDFQVVWEQTRMSMADVTQNPPLCSYYAALVGTVLGWSELALHWGFIVVAIALILGTYRLAQNFTRWPLFAALATLLTPGVLVSASSVMCDTMMLAIWVWAAVFWVEGLEASRPIPLFIASVLVAASALTKYFGVSLIPLLLAYSTVRLRAARSLLLWLLIPVTILACYQVWTKKLYGHGLLTGAAEFATSQRSMSGSAVAMGFVALSFAGGCGLLGLTFAPFVWSRKQIAIGALACAAASTAVIAHWVDPGLQLPRQTSTTLQFLTGTQLALWISGGISILGLAIWDWWEKRDANSLFLGLWVLGTFLFAAFVNYTVNARSVLPLIPAAGILLARRIEQIAVSPWTAAWRFGVVFLLSGLFSLWILAGDSSLADSEREAATLINARTRGHAGTLWFEGHWGFQYYMELLGGTRPVDFNQVETELGDIVVIPENNIHLRDIPKRFVAYRDGVSLPRNVWTTTISRDLGAGFYSSYWGPLPFAVGPVPPERYSILHLAAPPAANP